MRVLVQGQATALLSLMIPSSGQEKVVTYRPFRNPILATTRDADRHMVGCAWEALHFLNNHWHGPRDLAYQRAVRVCRDSVDGWTSAEIARLAFKQALRSAKLQARV